MNLNVGWKLYAGLGVTLLILAIISLSASTAGMVENVILGGLFVAVIITGAIAFFLSHRIAGDVGQVAAAMKAISVGNLGMKVDIKSKGELVDVAAAYEDMQAYLRDMSRAAEHIADGILADEVQPKSDDDVLGNALAKMTNNLNDVLRQLRESADSVAESRKQLGETAVEVSRLRSRWRLARSTRHRAPASRRPACRV